MQSSQHLKLHPIQLEKEVWENVPSIVCKSFHIVSSNQNNIKKWTDRGDDTFKELRSLDEQATSRLDALDVDHRATQNQLHQLSTEVTELRAQSEKEALAFSACTRQLLDSSLLFYERFLESFDSGFNLEQERLNLGSEAPADMLEELMLLRKLLHGRSGHIGTAFGNWSSWRGNQEEKSGFMRGKVGELHQVSELTRERLLSWKELLNESRHEVGSLSVALKRTQDEVRGMQAVIVKDDFKGMLEAHAQQLQQRQKVTDERMVTVQSNIDAHAASVDQVLDEMERELLEQINTHSDNFTQLLEGQLNPITAYLNNMHVKADAVRVELDQVSAKVPLLHSTIDDVASQLQRSSEEGRERSSSISARLDEFLKSSTQGLQRIETQSLGRADSLKDSCQELGSRVTELRTMLEDTSQALESLKGGELSNLGRNLMTLEHKVAKWVHSSQLPAKVSEARLYALESKIADETESRLLLEEAVKERGPSRGPLPSLPNSRPTTNGGRPRSKGSTWSAMVGAGEHSTGGLKGISPGPV